MPDLYLEPTEEDIKEFGQEALDAAWSNLCWAWNDGFLTEAGEP